MCTLILGVDVIGSGNVIAGANRDEDPSRPSDPPGLLLASPRVVGGRDRRAGGTWLAVREGRALVAMLNRRGAAPEAPRSRGLLALETAGLALPAPGPTGPANAALARAALEHALAAARAGAYAPFSMVFATPGASWMIAHEPGRAIHAAEISAGWHVLTHADLDDPGEPRAARLLREIAAWRPRSPAEALDGLAERLREHGEGADAVCIHDGRMATVSSSRVWLAPGAARYLHHEGRPCETAESDLTPLLDTGAPVAGRPTERR